MAKGNELNLQREDGGLVDLGHHVVVVLVPRARRTLGGAGPTERERESRESGMI